jgi:hypothetical protein
LLSGDDPNYWVKLTQQADAEYVAKKVRKMLADINQPGSKQVCWARGGGGEARDCRNDPAVAHTPACTHSLCSMRATMMHLT